MLHFKIVPNDHSVEPMNLIGHDAAGLFPAIQQLSIKHARVMRDGEYWITISLDKANVWHVLRNRGPSVSAAVALTATSSLRAGSI